MSAELLGQIDAAWRQLTAPGAPFELEEQLIDGRRMRVFRNAASNMIELLAPARKFGEREFVVLQQQRWTFARLFAEADPLPA